MRRKTVFNLLIVLGLVLALGGSVALARHPDAQGLDPQGPVSPQGDVGTGFTYQGRLVDNGTPVDGTCDFRFNLYDDQWISPSLIAGPVDRGSVAVNNGYFSTGLDFGANAFTGGGRQLEILVRCPAGSGSYTTLSGMVPLNPAPYAHSLRPGAVISGDLAGATGPNAALYIENSYGGMWASYGLQAKATNGTGVYGESLSSTGIGVEGKAASTGKGVRGETVSGYGVYGEATGGSGVTYGVYGKTNSPNGHGVYGTSPSTDPLYAGVTGANTGGGVGTGVYGYSVGGYGVRGVATSGTGIHGTGSTTGTVGIATGSGDVYGVYGKAASLSGRGVYGEGGWFGVRGLGTDPTGPSYGVFGQTDSTHWNSYGGYFENDNNVGLFARGYGGGSRAMGDIRLEGTWGVIGADDTSDSSISLLSNDDVVVYLDNDDNNATSCFSIYDPGFSAIVPYWEICHEGTTVAGTEAAAVDAQEYGTRKLYAMESPEVRFEDFGSGRLVNGAATVSIEPIFARTVNLEDYHVFLTPLGDCNGLYVATKTSSSFEVRELGGGLSNTAFDYRIVAKRLGYENVRMEEVGP